MYFNTNLANTLRRKNARALPDVHMMGRCLRVNPARKITYVSGEFMEFGGSGANSFALSVVV